MTNFSDSNPSSNKNLFLWVGGGCLVALTILFCAVTSGVVAFIVYGQYQESVQVEQAATVTVTVETAVLPPATQSISTPPASTLPPTKPAESVEAALTIPTATPLPSLFANVPPEVEQAPVPPLADQHLHEMLSLSYPYFDLYEAERQLGNEGVGSRLLENPSVYVQGDERVFVTDVGDIQATLRLQTALFSYWVDSSLTYSDVMLEGVANQLEKAYYPQLVDFFGQPANPGIDGVAQVSLLHYAGEGNDSQLGYFTSQDAFPRTIFADSNEQEVVYLNMGQLELGSDLYYGTTLHELQHLIQFNVDPNETTWLNEGLSQLAELYLELDTVEPSEYYNQPEIRLNTWEYGEDVQQAYYGGSYLFVTYLWERLFDAPIRELARHPANGMASVYAILQGHRPDLTLDGVFADFATAVFLDNPIAGDQYQFRSLNTRRPAVLNPDKTLLKTQVNELNQFGIHYLELDLSGEVQLSFAGDTQTSLIDGLPPNSDGIFWFAPPMDETAAALQAPFDLTAVRSATLQFSTWYDLETDWDYAYVLISSDGGATWRVLDADDISSNRVGQFGPAFNGSSSNYGDDVNGWVKQSYSLGEYVGQQVMIRFEVQTDYNGLGRGFAIDDIAIPEIGFSSASPDADSRWQALGGFVQTGHVLPQPWHVRVIHLGAEPWVQPLTLNELNQGQETVTLGDAGGVLVITTGTPFIAETAAYWLEINQQ